MSVEGHNALADAAFSYLKLSLDFLGIERQQIAALFQVRDRFSHHSVAEMSLSHAQQFRAAPCLVDRFNFRRWSNRIEFPGDE